jgi:hypothetical protein
MELTYKIGEGVSRQAIEEEIARAFKDLQANADVRRKLEAAGVDVVAAEEASAGLTVRTAGAGFAGEAVVVAIAIKVLSDVWTELVLPRLKKRFGADALVEQKRT